MVVTSAARGHSYTILANRTAVDRELTAMRKDNVLRTFRLNTGREDWGLMSTEHYIRLVSSVARCIRGSSRLQLSPHLYRDSRVDQIMLSQIVFYAKPLSALSLRVGRIKTVSDLRFFALIPPPPMLLILTMEPDTQCFRENTNRSWDGRSPEFSS